MMAAEPELQCLDEETASLRRHKLFPYPARSLQELRLASFRGFLAARGHLRTADDPAGWWLDGFWYQGRPKTAEELMIDKHAPEACAVCHEVRKRGRIVERSDAVFGKHVEYVCGECAGA